MKNKILFVVSLLFGLMYINAGLNKFLNYMPVPKDMPAELVKLMTAFMQIEWLMPLVGVVEIVGGILFIPAKTRALGAIIILPVMVGVLLTNIFNAPSGLPIAGVLMLVNLWVIIENRHKYQPMLTK
ncbi:DoxX family membrane protein [Chitinophaga sp. sic0106]|uniref:DoxX family membrane protein n=1 Tax=Chitinophaga sp. sic0106 TaxID=2854785 RepID=UPI001C4538EE|nr:DoxX family membrane protein [Chitinophaga sp. sic0106]MBV7530159.1 DoxX family membrane protein [Chitinophaga sp. sic0106]